MIPNLGLIVSVVAIVMQMAFFAVIFGSD